MVTNVAQRSCVSSVAHFEGQLTNHRGKVRNPSRALEPQGLMQCYSQSAVFTLGCRDARSRQGVGTRDHLRQIFLECCKKLSAGFSRCGVRLLEHYLPIHFRNSACQIGGEFCGRRRERTLRCRTGRRLRCVHVVEVIGLEADGSGQREEKEKSELSHGLRFVCEVTIFMLRDELQDRKNALKSYFRAICLF